MSHEHVTYVSDQSSLNLKVATSLQSQTLQVDLHLLEILLLEQYFTKRLTLCVMFLVIHEHGCSPPVSNLNLNVASSLQTVVGSALGTLEGKLVGAKEVVGLKVGVREGCGEGDLVGLAEGVLSELVGLMVGLLLGNWEGAVTAGQKPHDSGHAAPTSKPAFGSVSAPRLQYIAVRPVFLVNHGQASSTAPPKSRVKARVLSAQLSVQEPQDTWQAHLTLPYSQYLVLRSTELALFLFNHAQSCSGPESRLNLKVASSIHAAASAGMKVDEHLLSNLENYEKLEKAMCIFDTRVLDFIILSIIL